jgi:hypothetical protein
VGRQAGPYIGWVPPGQRSPSRLKFHSSPSCWLSPLLRGITPGQGLGRSHSSAEPDMSPIQVTDGIDPVLEEGGGVYARKDSLADGLAKVRPGKEASEAPITMTSRRHTKMTGI